MEVLNKLSDEVISKKLLNKINSEFHKKITIMEVCGTHTNVIMKSGIKGLLNTNIKLISGPGCPVCVTPSAYIDTAIKLSKRKDIIITTFGDVMRIPGSMSNLSKEKAKGSDVRVIYSPLDSLKVAKDNKDKKVVFLAIGFETTVPLIGIAIKQAKSLGVGNFFILNNLKTMPQAMISLINNSDIFIDGFLCPGHVATIIGEEPFKKIAQQYSIPMVISGFQVNDILSSVYKLIEMKYKKQFDLFNTYKRVVKEDGNKLAKAIIYDVFQVSDSEWRGLGVIKDSGLKLNEKYCSFDILTNLNIEMEKECELEKCRCGEILLGKIEPYQCEMFGKSCTSATPIGPCMVSEEGTCSAYYKYSYC